MGSTVIHLVFVHELFMSVVIPLVGINHISTLMHDMNENHMVRVYTRIGRRDVITELKDDVLSDKFHQDLMKKSTSGVSISVLLPHQRH